MNRNKFAEFLSGVKGFTLVEILLTLGIMGGVGLLTARLLENYRVVQNKALSDLDIQIKHLEISSLLRSQITCSHGIQDASGKNLLFELSASGVDVGQIIQYSPSPGGSPVPSLNTNRNVRVSPPGEFDLFGGKLRIDRIRLVQNTPNSKIGKVIISYETNLGSQRKRTINRFIHFPFSGEGTSRVCGRSETEDVFCRSKKTFCESLGKNKAMWMDFSEETLTCECIACTRGMFIGVNNELARGCVDIHDFNERKILQKNSNVGIITHEPNSSSAYGYGFQGCPESNQAITSYNPVTKEVTCSSVIKDEQQMNCDPVITEGEEGEEIRSERIPWYQYVGNQLQVYCVDPENFSPGQGCPQANTLCVGQEAVLDNFGVPCKGTIVPQNSSFYIDNSDMSCAPRDDLLIKPELGKFRIIEIKCNQGNHCGQKYDCSGTESSRRYYLPCDN